MLELHRVLDVVLTYFWPEIPQPTWFSIENADWLAGPHTMQAGPFPSWSQGEDLRIGSKTTVMSCDVHIPMNKKEIRIWIIRKSCCLRVLHLLCCSFYHQCKGNKNTCGMLRMSSLGASYPEPPSSQRIGSQATIWWRPLKSEHWNDVKRCIWKSRLVLNFATAP